LYDDFGIDLLILNWLAVKIYPMGVSKKIFVFFCLTGFGARWSRPFHSTSHRSIVRQDGEIIGKLRERFLGVRAYLHLKSEMWGTRSDGEFAFGHPPVHI
jgi:hypothetical protein